MDVWSNKKTPANASSFNSDISNSCGWTEEKNTKGERRMFSSHLNSLAQDLEDAVKTIMLYSVRDTDTKTAGQWH